MPVIDEPQVRAACDLHQRLNVPQVQPRSVAQDELVPFDVVSGKCLGSAGGEILVPAATLARLVPLLS